MIRISTPRTCPRALARCHGRRPRHRPLAPAAPAHLRLDWRRVANFHDVKAHCLQRNVLAGERTVENAEYHLNQVTKQLELPESIEEERRMWRALNGFVTQRSDLYIARLDRYRKKG